MPRSEPGADESPKTQSAAVAFALERSGVVLAALGFAMLVVKVSRVSHLNSRTSLGLLETAGPVEVVLGALLSQFTEILFTVCLLVTWWVAGAFGGPRKLHEGHLAAVAVLVVALLVMPWPLLAGVVVAGAIRYVTSSRRDSLSGEDLPAPRRKIRGYYILATFIGVVLLADADVWLPPEAFEMDSGSVIVGYVLDEPSNAGAWVKVLTEEEREIVDLRQNEILERRSCRYHLRWDPEEYASVFQLVVREGYDIPEPECPPSDEPEEE